MDFNVILMILGVSAAGIVLGALPGIGPSIGMTLLMPFTFFLSPEVALSLLGTMYVSVIYGGGISAILANIPGDAGSIATCFDGYPMTQQGKGGIALGLSLGASFASSVMGVLALAVVAPLISTFVLKFGPAEYFWLTLFALTIIAALSKKSFLRGLISAALGCTFAFVGYGSVTATSRLTFGRVELIEGIELMSVVIGMFAVAEFFSMMEKGGKISITGKISGSVWQGVLQVFKYPVTFFRSTIMGIVIGAIPGIGMATSNVYAYAETARNAKDPASFGKGNPEGLIAPEAANNATVGGSLIPALTLGIPGSVSTGVFLAGVMLHGMRPGYDLFQSNPLVMSTLIVGLCLGSICFFVLGLLFGNSFVKLTVIPTKILIPILIVLTFAGAFVLNNSIFDVFSAVFFGCLGYIMNKYGYSSATFLIAFLLTPIAETNFNRALMRTGNSYPEAFFSGVFSWILIAMIVFSVIYAIKKK